MKTILFGEAASDSGSLGFSEAWPLARNVRLLLDGTNRYAARVPGPLPTHHPAQTAWTFILSATSTMSSTFA
jgi:hypothetical protein